MSVTYGSVCSGIESASVAWEPLGMVPLWFSQFDPDHNYRSGPDFPSKVLAHHWPHVPNLGDMTRIAQLIRCGMAPAPDVLVGGTPCQAFSVAGLRESLGDDRGQLTLEYVRVLNAIDEQREREGEQPAAAVWENVPGVLSTKDNAFGCFLGALAGSGCELQPPNGKRWGNAGLVVGPQRAVAWRILDAQFFGVAQRRRRVFVVASARDGFDPGQVLFEFDGLRRDTPPSRETRQETADRAGAGVKVRSHWDDPEAPHPTLSQSHNTGGIGQSNQELFGQRGAGLVPSCGEVARTLLAKPNDSLDHTLDTYICASTGFRMAAFGEYAQDETASTMKARDYKDATDLAVTVVHGTQDPITAHNVALPLGRNNGQENALVYSVALRGRDGGATAELGDNVAGCLRASSGGGDKPHVLAPVGADCYNGAISGDIAATLGSRGSHQSAAGPQLLTNMRVRRLTPTECERLQGFPDGHTAIPGASDGPRYKSIGNSKAVPVIKRVGKRLLDHLKALGNTTSN